MRWILKVPPGDSRKPTTGKRGGNGGGDICVGEESEIGVMSSEKLLWGRAGKEDYQRGIGKEGWG